MILVCQVDLGEPIPEQRSRWGAETDFDTLRLLVRHRGWPLGVLSLPTGLTDDELSQRFSTEFGRQLDRDGDVRAAAETGGPRRALGDLPGEAMSAPDPVPPATVVVTTCGRHEALVRCLESILALDYPDFEVIVVDNRPVGSATPGVVTGRFGDDVPLRVVPEFKRGLSAARNRGLVEAKGDVVAFTDDDVAVDRAWLGALVAAMSCYDAVAVSGLILSAELETRNQQLQEEFCGFSKGFAIRTFDAAAPPPDPLFPYAPGVFGSGANAAFRVQSLLRLGGFDESLGAGTRALGGEDLDLFLRLILAGERIVYQPGALIWHHHKESDAELRRQVRHYGTGLAAMMTKQVASGRNQRRQLVRRMPYGFRRLLDPRSPKNDRRSDDFPRSLALLEMVGLAYGPLAYLRSRLTDRRTEPVVPRAAPPGGR